MTRLTNLTMDDRPRPIRTAATDLTRWFGVAGSFVIALVGWGVLTAAQGDAVTGLLGVIPGVVNAVATVLTAFGITRRVEPLVTPISDPRDNQFRPLVSGDKVLPADGHAAGGDIAGDGGRY